MKLSKYLQKYPNSNILDRKMFVIREVGEPRKKQNGGVGNEQIILLPTKISVIRDQEL